MPENHPSVERHAEAKHAVTNLLALSLLGCVSRPLLPWEAIPFDLEEDCCTANLNQSKDLKLEPSAVSSFPEAGDPIHGKQILR